MSATRGNVDPTDLYSTPAWAVDAVLPEIPVAGVVLDPGCGEGAILARVAEQTDRCYLVGVEIDAARAERARGRVKAAVAAHPGNTFGHGGWDVHEGDFLTWGDGRDVRADTVILNPPFALAEQFLERALAIAAKARGTVACLLRANWYVPECRADFVRRHPFDVGYLSKRPAFAASLKCGGDGPKRRNHCDWATIQPLDAPRPETCPGCSKKVDVTTNDSADYAWLLFGPGRGGRFFPLVIPQEARRSRARDLRFSEAKEAQP